MGSHRLGSAACAAVLMVSGCSTSSNDHPRPGESPSDTAVPLSGDRVHSGGVGDRPPVTGGAPVGSGGPVAAAVAIAEWRQDLAALPANEALEQLQTVGHPASVDDLATDLATDLAQRDAATPAGLGLRVAVIETKLLYQTDQRASVAVWAAQIITGAGATRVTYNTLTYELAPLDGHWLLVAETTLEGPVPTPVQHPTDPAAFEAVLTGFSDPQTTHN